MILDVRANNKPMSAFQTGGYGTVFDIVYAVLMLASFLVTLGLLLTVQYPDTTTFILVIFFECTDFCCCRSIN
ncbi:MAG: hypothetical protein TR69_WS6001000082 [candidate division WS6 bacterium OLB20]|uniref:Uncharacterized protein n=1 Tax=candidate division WS6 bacterium OLB20 TaxID=1617426 RepID=A0A136M149_9BACT|nr:MAG: hypothetical protein TR69_WS6001000082 [candidate division WS6 bacterium OLB20]